MALHLKKFLATDYLEDLNRRYMSMLVHHLDSFDIRDEWTELPTLEAVLISGRQSRFFLQFYSGIPKLEE